MHSKHTPWRKLYANQKRQKMNMQLLIWAFYHLHTSCSKVYLYCTLKSHKSLSYTYVSYFHRTYRQLYDAQSKRVNSYTKICRVWQQQRGHHSLPQVQILGKFSTPGKKFSNIPDPPCNRISGWKRLRKLHRSSLKYLPLPLGSFAVGTTSGVLQRRDVRFVGQVRCILYDPPAPLSTTLAKSNWYSWDAASPLHPICGNIILRGLCSFSFHLSCNLFALSFFQHETLVKPRNRLRAGRLATYRNFFYLSFTREIVPPVSPKPHRPPLTKLHGSCEQKM